MNVLIDTSAWIDFFQNTGGVAGDLVAELIRLDQAYVTGPVMAELLHGGEDWIKTGSILHALRKKDLSVPLTDVLIASVALHNKMTVLTLDKHFQHLPVECVEIQEDR